MPQNCLLCSKLCPLILEGANLYVQIIVLLCYVQHHNFITNLKPGLGTYREIYQQIIWTIHYPSCEDFITGYGHDYMGRVLGIRHN